MARVFPGLHCASVQTCTGMIRLGSLLCFQHAHFIPITGVGKSGAYELVHGDMPRQHSFRTTLRTTGPVPAHSRHGNAIGTQLRDAINSGLTR